MATQVTAEWERATRYEKTNTGNNGAKPSYVPKTLPGFIVKGIMDALYDGGYVHDEGVYVKDIRFHHGTAGNILEILGQVTKVPALADMGAVLCADDQADKDEWWSFKSKQEEDAERRRRQQAQQKPK